VIGKGGKFIFLSSNGRRVLHNIMAIFTFMGTTVMRQDDNYTFHVIQQSLETVIPPLVSSAAASQANKSSVEEMSVGVLKVLCLLFCFPVVLSFFFYCDVPLLWSLSCFCCSVMLPLYFYIVVLLFCCLCVAVAMFF
jgi:hypothetical protein